MNTIARRTVETEITTQEKLLFETTERLSRIRDGRIAVKLHLSRLRPQNRQGGYLRMVERLLDSTITKFGGQMFILGNADIVFQVNQPDMKILRDQIHKLRGLFASDPLTHDDTGDGVDRFCTVYDLTFDYDTFHAMVLKVHSQARIQASSLAATPVLRPLDPDNLGPVLDKVARLDISPFIRRQSAIAINANGNAEVIFQEMFIGMTDLQAAVAPEINLQANRWTFQILSSTLDEKLLAVMPSLQLVNWPRALHLNLTLGSLFEDGFHQFEKAMGERVQIGIEMQFLDLLANGRSFPAARNEMRRRDYRLVIDGLNELTLHYLDAGLIEADLYKIDWSPELRDPARGDALWDAAQRLGVDKLLLARCDSEAAITWGLSRGLSRFQGRYVESMLAATTMTVCEQAHNCRLNQCAQRHSMVVGPIRGECFDHEMLDTAPALRALQKKAAE